MQEFDLVVVGVGMGAVSAANKCARAGWKVAVVDELPYGGTCALRGCDPKKMLRRGAEVIDAAQLMQGKGIETGDLRINWSDLVAFKRTWTDVTPGRIEAGFSRNGVAMFHGTARFIDKRTIDVDGDHLHGNYVLIATGAKPRSLEFPGAEYVTTSDQFMELEQLPERILFVGGGYVSFEFAHIAARAGAKAVIVERGEHPLKAFDPDLVDKLVARTRAAGIDVHLASAVQGISKSQEYLTVSATVDGADEHFDVDLVVHGAGRVPALDRLDLEAAGVEAGPAGVTVNEHLQSVSNAAVYAAGDSAASGGAPLTPVAVFEGKIAASNMLRGNQAVADYRGVPSAVFTIPELTRVGLLESEAKAQNLDVEVKVTDNSEWYSQLRVGESCAGAKVLIDRSTGQIAGAHLLGPGTGELINFFGLAMRLELKAPDLRRMVSAYPSVGSDLGSFV